MMTSKNDYVIYDIDNEYSDEIQVLWTNSIIYRNHDNNILNKSTKHVENS